MTGADKTCSTCKHWERMSGHGERFGSCGSDGFAYGYGIVEDNLRDDQVMVEDDEGWGFFTGPAFGCVHHEERQT